MNKNIIKASALLIGTLMALSACKPATSNPTPIPTPTIPTIPITVPVTTPATVTTTTTPVTVTTTPVTVATTIPVTTSTTTPPVADVSYELAKCGYKYADDNSGEISPNFSFKVTKDKAEVYFSVAPTSISRTELNLTDETNDSGLKKLRAAKSGDTVILTRSEASITSNLTYATGSGNITFTFSNNNVRAGSGLGTNVHTQDAGITVFSNTNYESQILETGVLSTSHAYNGTWQTAKYFGSNTKGSLLQLLDHLILQTNVNVSTPIGQGFGIRSQIIEQTITNPDQTETIAFYNSNGVGCSGEVHLKK